MPLQAGEPVPYLSLRDLEGREHSLPSGAALLVFYKVSCPTCQLTLPFVERMHGAYKGGVSFLGVAQDSPKEVASFAHRYSLTFTQLVDPPPYRASVDYDVQVVPTLYLIKDGKILRVEESFLKSALESLNKELALLSGNSPIPLFEGVSVPPFKPG